MKYLGIDYGTKRTGIATSDDEGKIAFPLRVIETSKGLLEAIVEIVRGERIGMIVLGESRDLLGKENPVMKQITKLKSDLEGEGMRVVYEREFYTSQQAARLQGENDMHDASAAAVILQSYLDKQHTAAVDSDPYASV